MDRDKREFRQNKRKLKQKGSQRRRRLLKRDLIERPEEAPYSREDFGRYGTAPLNGNDHDATRRRSAARSANPTREAAPNGSAAGVQTD